MFFLFTVLLYCEKLCLIAFLCLLVDSDNIKGNFLNKTSNKCCTFPHVRLLFYSLLFFKSMILVVFLEIHKQIKVQDRGYSNNFLFCHWRLNSNAAHNFIKMPLLQVCNLIHKFDSICLSETYSDNSFHSDDDQLALLGSELTTQIK